MQKCACENSRNSHVVSSTVSEIATVVMNCSIHIKIMHHSCFSASVESSSKKTKVEIGCRVIKDLSLLLTSLRTYEDRVFHSLSVPRKLDYHLVISLTWIALHEMQHAELGHFEFLGNLPTLYLVSKGKRTLTPLQELPKFLWKRVGPCLELQADHGAIELVLDSYSKEGWGELLAKISSVVAVIVLIEKHDDDNDIEHSTHPKAATRIFQLLGHVTEMWSLPAHAKAKVLGETAICEDDLPSDEEKQLFSKEVILPAFWDAVALAEAAKAKNIISDLGSPEDFFADIGRAKLGQWDELVTVGAIEWAELKDANDLILPLLPINQTTN